MWCRTRLSALGDSGNMPDVPKSSLGLTIDGKAVPRTVNSMTPIIQVKPNENTIKTTRDD